MGLTPTICAISAVESKDFTADIFYFPFPNTVFRVCTTTDADRNRPQQKSVPKSHLLPELLPTVHNFLQKRITSYKELFPAAPFCGVANTARWYAVSTLSLRCSCTCT